MEKLTEQILQWPPLAGLAAHVSRKHPLHLRGAPGSLAAFGLASLYRRHTHPVLYVANSLEQAELIHEDIRRIAPEAPNAFLPGLETEPYEQVRARPELVSMRLETMQVFLEEERFIAVATAQALMEALPLPESFLDLQVYLRVGKSQDFEQLREQLSAAGFERVDIVEQVGEYSVRGGIVDIFAFNYDEPLRVEFFGNQVESIRRFDVITQRTTGKYEEVVVLPHTNGGEKQTFLHELLPAETILFFEDREYFLGHIESFARQAARNYENDPSLGLAEPPPEEKYARPADVRGFMENHPLAHTDLVQDDRSAVVDLKGRPHPDFNGSIKKFLEYLRHQEETGARRSLVIQSYNAEQSQRLREIIEEEDILLPLRYTEGGLHAGFILPDAGLELLTDHQIFNRSRRHKVYRSFKSGSYLRQLGGLHVYDYVVHVDYGIGQYLGPEVVSYGNIRKECLKIAYRDGDHLLVSVDRLNRVQKYSSEDGGRPQLSKLGGRDWERAKKKTKESLKKIAAELLQVYAGRKAQEGFAFVDDNHWQKELEASFPYQETPDQLTAIESVKKDMEHPKPMDRLLCGDVGFGKTEVALRAAFKAVMSGKQVALLVPTTILAFQHYENFRKRLASFPVQVEMVNRFRTPKQQREILEGVLAGRVDILIGTHRLLSGDVHFKDLGLLIIDEEQRFGVRHKEKLKKYRLSVDILSMTATPIPRTLHMALMGARDFSNIETPPANRLPVHTEILHWNDAKLHHIIKRELERGGQVYFVHNRVETIEAMKQSLEEILPGARIAVGHGQLPERQLEKVMLDFMDHKYDILVASMIIENGLDIPNVNTMIINRADKFGLGQLYQLRGRVGRSNRQAYAYLLVPPLDKLTDLARKRLQTIQDLTDLGSGYKIALRDLEIRGAGNLLGKEQSGFVQTVGFDLYCRILDEAVAELKKGLPEESPEQARAADYMRTDPEIDVNFDLLIPHDYIENDLERISIYHRLVNYRTMDQIDQLRLELRDRFGQVPDEVNLFLDVMKLKILGGRLYARRIIVGPKTTRLIFDPRVKDDESFFKETIPALLNQKEAAVRFLDQEKDLAVAVTLKGENNHQRLEFAKKVLQSIIQ